MMPRAVDPTELVVLPATPFDYRVAGAFLEDSAPVNPPLAAATFDRPVAIMKDHVSRADYQRCVDAVRLQADLCSDRSRTPLPSRPSGSTCTTRSPMPHG